ncbi:hypothetical protein FVQ98_14210 [Ottowia sp. GY511]|nr:hypothetical protein [Ottowia sp. GY511]TXK26526.1 hypothetical protein FVQ98_14210 [Ottowia sp. GY511]
MFAVIDTKGANRIVINIPQEGAEKSLPALARMLESNAIFIQQSWRELTLQKPEMSIVLGNEYRTDGEDVLAIQSESAVISDDFVNATPAVLVSNKATMDRQEAELKKARAELEFLGNYILDKP